MSIKIGINGSASFNALKDLIVGTSTTAKQDVNRVEDWNGTIIWQRKAPDVPMDQDNTVITIYPTSYNESGSSISWGPYKPSVTKVTVNGVEIGTDKYQIEGYSNNSGTGTVSGQKGKVTISGKNGYTGTVYKEFSISYTYEEAKIDITNNCTIYLSQDSKTITNDQSTWTASKTDLTIDVSSVWLDSPFQELIAGTDYTIEYEYPDSWKYEHDKEGSIPKTVTVKVTGKGSYKGTKSKPYTVTHKYEIVKKMVWATYKFDGSGSGKADGQYLNIFEPNSGTSTATSMELGPNIRGVAYGNNMNVMITKTSCKYSYNGGSWTATDTGLASNSVICFSGGKFIIGGDLGTQYSLRSFVTSVDGINWSSPVEVEGSGYGDALKLITAHGNTIIAYNANTTGAYEGYCKSSDGGSTWEFLQSSVDVVPASLCYANGYFYAGGEPNGTPGTNVYRMDASSGTVFSLVKSLGSNGPNRMASNGSTLVIAASQYQLDGSYKHGVFYSTDYGTKWTFSNIFSSSDQNALKDCKYINGTFYLLSCSSRTSWKIYSSTDGISWSLWITVNHSSPDYIVDRLQDSTKI